MSNDSELINTRAYFERILAEREKRQIERERVIVQRIDDLEKGLDFQFAMRDKAIEVAEKLLQERLAAHNDLLRQMRERDSTYASTLSVGHIEEKLDNHDRSLARIAGALILVTVLMPMAVAVLSYLLSK